MKNLANKITIIRICLVPIFMLFAYTNRHYIAFSVFVLASLSDFLDGYIARNYNQVSTFGKFMDPLADKVLVIAAMCYFIESGRFGGWAVALVCFREFAVSGLRLIAAQKNLIIAAGPCGKIKTAVTMIGISAMFLFRSPLLDRIVMFAIVIVTLISGIDYFIKNKGVFDS